MARQWTCKRRKGGVECLQVNPMIRKNCQKCGKPRRPRKSAAKLGLEKTYEEFIEMQGGEFCGICGALRKPERKLNRDHSHSRHRPRGLLCFACNFRLQDYMTAEWLDRAAAYVRAAEARWDAEDAEDELAA